MKTLCPWCLCVLGFQGYQPAFDRAVCPRCGRECRPGEGIDARSMDRLARPPRWARISGGDSPRLVLNGRSPFICFVAVWNFVLIWPLLGMLLAAASALWQAGGRTIPIGMLVILMVATTYGWWQLAIPVFGRLDARLANQQVSVFWGIGRLGYRRSFRLASIAHVIRSSNRVGGYSVVIITPERSWPVASGFPTSRPLLLQAWLCSLRRNSTRQQGLCPKCSYDLAATAPGLPSPECGTHAAPRGPAAA